MRVFLTGGSGFVGLNIVQSLLRHGHEPVAYVRPGSNTDYLDQSNVHRVCGQLDDVMVMTQAMRGVDAVIHTAGSTSSDSRDWPILQATNIEGTRAVLSAARQARVGRVVYTSTTSTIGSNGDGRRPADEDTPLNGFRRNSPYGRSKLEAERLLVEAAREGMHCVILNPAEVIGAYDHNLQWGRMVLALAGNVVPFVPSGTGCFAPAADVAEAHVSALSAGRSGVRYILGGHNVPFAHFLDEVSQVLGQGYQPRDRRPYAWQVAKARFLSMLPGKLHQHLPVDAYRMRVFAGKYLFDDTLARLELGYSPRPLRTAITECVNWYRDNGFLPAQAGQSSEHSAAA